MVSLMAPPLKRFFKFFFCLAVEDLYIEDAISDDVSECRTLCDLRMCLVGLVGCEGSPIAIIKIKHMC